MKIAACAMHVSEDAKANLHTIEAAVHRAHARGARLILFPECALSGYPPRDIPSSAAADFAAIDEAFVRLEQLAARCEMCIVAGSITREADAYFNSAIAFMPGRKVVYHKRALWGWDADNFVPGSRDGIFEFDGVKIGMRICYEVRFPEYFRELYQARTDLNLLLFYDVMDAANPERYELIRAHVRTRAAENICPILCSNAVHPFQTAPAGFFNQAGQLPAKLECSQDDLLIYDWQMQAMDFSECGRKTTSDLLLGF